ncbi:hypothetical protein JX265_005725 [Neoarthrinium moseri]|uniref:Pyridoxal phosphate-dependent transferase n=1 Tax=Neoarthrinium moseri TaxID=1658444 RepID=A0A9Q0ARH2_9PEZI|nr:hypothetical protein JX265_005725 [Neoarthrinium moseri]
MSHLNEGDETLDEMSRVLVMDLKTHTIETSVKELCTASVTELSDPESESETATSPELLGSKTVLVPTGIEEVQSTVIRDNFKAAQSQWIDEPITKKWRNPHHFIHKALGKIDQLRAEWSSRPIAPFQLTNDTIWLDTGRTLAQSGLPWHNNQINMPDELDTSWPFHFKSFERAVIQAKGSRVGDANASGYVCNSHEGHLFCLRAIQQELRKKCPNSPPLLVFDKFSYDVIESAEIFFGLETCHLDLSKGLEYITKTLEVATGGQSRPIIFAATLATINGCCDNLGLIQQLSLKQDILLHLDMSRNFDYITTMTEETRRKMGILSFELRNKSHNLPIQSQNGIILASTIVAGSSDHPSAATAALKPRTLGGKHARIAYTRASDSTLAGSRDALAPLWLALHEARFGERGFCEMYEHCSRMRSAVAQSLEYAKCLVIKPPYSLDLIVQRCPIQYEEQLLRLGGRSLGMKEVLITVHAGITQEDIATICQGPSNEMMTMSRDSSTDKDFTLLYPIEQSVKEELTAIVQSWKVATRSAAGYPFHMGSYSALGPVIGHFLDVNIPLSWIRSRATEIIDARMASFGISLPQMRHDFRGAFTNGSTMGNRIGIHAALKQSPGAFVYFSAESHYSVIKTLRDCDRLTNRWSQEEVPRFHQIPCGAKGSILVNLLVQQAVLDKQICLRKGLEYSLILFANMGTTFVGARDDIVEIQRELRNVGIGISYIHVDGALDLGFGRGSLSLGPPGTTGCDGQPAVQGITLSHHKALGNMVSGEVIAYSPDSDLVSVSHGVDPRVVFETWIYSQVYREEELAVMFDYCLDNATRLEHRLRELGYATKRNADSIITVFERPPAWLIEEFSLRPEGNWVHFITMPHISPETVEFFLERLAGVERSCALAIHYVAPCIDSILGMIKGEVRSTLELCKGDDSDAEKVSRCVKTGLRSAMTFAAVDDGNELQVVFTAESLRDMVIRIGPVLIKPSHRTKAQAIVELAKQFWGFVTRHINAKIENTALTYTVYQFGEMD